MVGIETALCITIMNSPAVKKEGRNTDGTFVEGHKHHAPIRSKRLPRSILAEAVSEEDLKELLIKGMAEAKKDINGPWGMFIASRLWSASKAMAPRVEFDLDVSNPTRAAEDILSAVGKGELSSDQAKDLVQSLAALQQISEVEMMKSELAELREMISDPRK